MNRSKALQKVIQRTKLTDMVTRHVNRERTRSRIYQIRRQPVQTNETNSDILNKSDSSI